jgi:enamine deaminase RidA (YjgF/YER057c/UK114 family)
MALNNIQPDGWARPRGYANGIVCNGPLLFVAGQVGWDPTKAEPTFVKGFAEQFGQALSNVMDVVKKAGSAAEDVVQMTVYVTDRDEYITQLKEVGAQWQKHLGRHYPAMALIQVAALLSPEAKVEIQAVAVVRGPA